MHITCAGIVPQYCNILRAFVLSTRCEYLSHSADKTRSIFISFWYSLSLHRASLYKCFTTANRCTYLLVLESTKIYIKIYTKMLLHISVYDHHQGACTWALWKLQLLKTSGKSTSLYTMQWCGSILCQVYSGEYAVCSAERDNCNFS